MASSIKVQLAVLMMVMTCTWLQYLQLAEAQQAAPDGTVPAEPSAVVPAPAKVPTPVPSTPAVQPVSQAVPPVAPVAPATYPDLSGTTTQTKNPDGSTITVTHFKGNVPASAVGFHPYGGAGYPGWGSPVYPPPFYYPWGPQPQYGQQPPQAQSAPVKS